MPVMRCHAVRWVADEPQPGWVEVRFTDAAGRVWQLFDKPPIFDSGDRLTPTSAYPVPLELPVTVLARRPSPDGDVATIALPWGLDENLGQDRFDVRCDDLRFGM